MARPGEFTLEELANIALGGPEFNEFNMSVLHSLMNIFLKKVGLESETISITSTEGLCLETMLSETSPPALQFDDSEVSLLQPKLHRLEKSTKKTRERLKNHIRLSKEFDERPKLCEEKYLVPCDEKSEIGCFLANDCDFLSKLQRRLAFPLVLKLFTIEREIYYLNDDINSFLIHVKEHNNKIALIDACVGRIEDLQRKIERNHLQFVGTMEEVQDILDIKLDKVHVPALKQFAKHTLIKMNEFVQELSTPPQCMKPSGTIDGVRCISCGSRQVAVEKGALRMGMLPSATPHKPKRMPKTAKRAPQKKDAYFGGPIHVFLTLDFPPKKRADDCIPGTSREALELAKKRN